MIRRLLLGWVFGLYLSLILHLASVRAASGSSLVKQSPWNLAGPLQAKQPTCPRAVTRAADSSSWTHQPYCVHPKGKREPKYCLYSTFLGNSGIGILTTPDVARRIAATFQDPGLVWEEEERRATARGEPPYEIKEIPGKGLGVVANRIIQRNEIVMRDQPLLLTKKGRPEFVKKPQAQLLAQRALEQLPIRDQGSFLNLARSHGGNAIEDIMRTNSFGVYINSGEHRALFPLVSVR
jgi:hypothetical protein